MYQLLKDIVIIKNAPPQKDNPLLEYSQTGDFSATNEFNKTAKSLKQFSKEAKFLSSLNRQLSLT